MIIKNVYDDGRIICMKGEHYHCLTEPAIVEADGTQEWYCNGELHRIDGPAVTHPDGTTEYWVMGEELTRQKFLSFFVESDD